MTIVVCWGRLSVRVETKIGNHLELREVTWWLHFNAHGKDSR